MDYVDIPGRGRCRVYLARYSYDPLKQSPNENPEAELALSAGEYVLIFGEIDEDGFYNGELLDGQRGLVPSNFIEKLTGKWKNGWLAGWLDADERSMQRGSSIASLSHSLSVNTTYSTLLTGLW